MSRVEENENLLRHFGKIEASFRDNEWVRDYKLQQTLADISKSLAVIADALTDSKRWSD